LLVPAPTTTSKQPSAAPKAPAPTSAATAKKSSKQAKEKTECVCAGDHYPNTVLDEVYDGNLEAMYSLLYTCGFMKKFLTEDEGLSGKKKRPLSLLLNLTGMMSCFL
jgi:hypothetical protein